MLAPGWALGCPDALPRPSTARILPVHELRLDGSAERKLVTRRSPAAGESVPHVEANVLEVGLVHAPAPQVCAWRPVPSWIKASQFISAEGSLGIASTLVFSRRMPGHSLDRLHRRVWAQNVGLLRRFPLLDPASNGAFLGSGSIRELIPACAPVPTRPAVYATTLKHVADVRSPGRVGEHCRL